ncbi:hypothetical protein BJF78_22220 [Pseudonocardia sp. CNS-139]|nr:hypothetical protein BJF78_22220 [Pseudonocardia sp. CNS-139]
MRAGGLGGLVVDDSGGGIAGATVTVSGTTVGGDGASGTATAGPDGAWAVGNLPAGTYTVSVRQPAGYGNGPDTPGAAGGRASAPNRITGIDLAPGETAAGYRFTGTLGAIAGRVTVGGAIGLAEVEVGLTGTATSGESVVQTTATGPDGAFRFEGLPAGRYRVTETQPQDYASTDATTGTAGGYVATTDVLAGIALDAGESARGYEFEEAQVRPGSDRQASVRDRPGA